MNTQNIKIVVGASYGDEGKGLATDYFASKAEGNIIGVLTNGSSQRAHTVDTSDGKHHVFSHFSSATFRGADTYISKYFVVNPIKFVEEYLELQRDFGISPKVYMHPECKFVTPWDIISNLVELQKTEHTNSTGCGFWKTLKRYKDNVYPVSLQEACSTTPYFKGIKQYYKEVLETVKTPINMAGLERHFLDDMFFLFQHVIWIGDTILNKYETIIFENGQGLMIGKQQPENIWENCTPSDTGIKYATEIIKNMNPIIDKNIEACYVSRTYVTRHGDGFLPFECVKQDIDERITIDWTNTFNICQGRLRYGALDPYILVANILKDYSSHKIFENKMSCSLMFTHWNECPVDFGVFNVLTGIDTIYISHDKTAESVRLKEEVFYYE